jgi:hypothetical protein
LLFANTYLGRLSLLCLIIGATSINTMLGLFFAILLMLSNPVVDSPNIITQKALPSITNYGEVSRSILNKKIKHENYVFVKPFKNPLEFLKFPNSTVSPYNISSNANLFSLFE